MSLWDNVTSLFSNSNDEPIETVSEPTVPEIVNEKSVSDINWKLCEVLTKLWQYDFALSVVQNILSTFLINVVWKTYKGNKIVKGKEWYKLNIAPNKKEVASDFYSKLAEKLINDNKALIIEQANGELFVADSFVKEETNDAVKPSKFTSVVIDSLTLNKRFEENKNCIYIKMPQNDKTKQVFLTMANDYSDLKQLIRDGADKALGMKLSLNLGAQAKAKYDAQYIKQLQDVFEPLMKKRNAVFLTYKGEELTDLTERQRGSEVQQVLEAVENNIKVNDEILCNVGKAYSIPKKFMTGDYNQDNADNYAMAITMFGKPILKKIAQKFTIFYLDEEDVLGGSKIEASLDSIKFTDALSLANSVDKLIGSSAYVVNEVREKLGDDPVEGGDKRVITKNYAPFSEYMKGGEK